MSPGWIWANQVFKTPKFERARWGPIWGKLHMLRRCGEPDEVAEAVVFLLSEEQVLSLRRIGRWMADIYASAQRGLGRYRLLPARVRVITADAGMF